MPNLTAILPLQHEGTQPLKLCLEPVCEYFTIQPGMQIEVHAIFDQETRNLTFTVAPGDSMLTIYAPGEIAGFIDCYATCDGARLLPDDC